MVIYTHPTGIIQFRQRFYYENLIEPGVMMPNYVSRQHNFSPLHCQGTIT